ncbi:SRP72 RNA-binding domain-containing protein [Perilla frutescens var. hirtella]|uniref:Signal recognition particle subunit SRP72 n=1 Tax=Perilla frutescens var. hirtella TaxID=608512 RepID=A0AAD4J079_PERFH|nr:SRP72 RNA-binding domain-containing protein [Perilla frutescens var. hirtella]
MAPKAAAVAAAPTVPIEDLFTSLNRHINRSEFHLAVRVSDQVLSIAPQDEDAIRCKVVALIKNDKIDDALSAIQVFSRKSSVDLTFYKAYCLYRQNKLDEALVSLKGHDGNSAAMLLESQILFRLGKMDACVDLYQRLQKSKIHSLEINFVAALVSAGRATEVQGTIESLRIKPISSFELAYNVACSLVERNKHKDAEQLLLSARRIGQETLMEENLLDDDIETELAPVVVQLGYVQQVLGNTQEALESYVSLIKKNLADETSLAVAKSNLVALKGPKDVSDGLRKLDKLIVKGEGPTFSLASGLDLKLSPKQREAIYVNRLLLLLHSNKLDQARELASALPTMFPNSIMPVLLQAAVHVRENKANKAEEILGHFANKFPDKSNTILLARAQVAASAGHPQIAAESLLKIQGIQHMPATIATIVALKERAGDIDGADAVFDSAIDWWSNAMAEDNKLDVIMREAALFKLRHGKKNEAARLFEELIKSHRSIEALVGLIQTAAHTDISKAESYEKQLKPLAGLKGIDVDGFDPANPGPAPDPERWLPKRERSSYRPKRKDKRAAQIRGSQGAVAKESAANSVNSKSNQTANSKGSTQNSSTEQTKPSSKNRKKSRN